MGRNEDHTAGPHLHLVSIFAIVRSFSPQKTKLSDILIMKLALALQGEEEQGRHAHYTKAGSPFDRLLGP